MTQKQFRVSKAELDMVINLEQSGMLMVPVKLIGIDTEDFVFEKIGKIAADGEFRPESVTEMRSRIGIVEDPEKPLKED